MGRVQAFQAGTVRTPKGKHAAPEGPDGKPEVMEILLNGCVS